MTQSLYEKYGGFETVSSIVHTFYDEVRESEQLARYFDRVDMPRLIKHQTVFLCKVLGGPDNYEGRVLAKAHASLHITDPAFDEVVTILKEVLEDAGMEPEDVASVLDVVAGARDVIVDPAAV